MRSANFYSRLIFTKKNAKGRGLAKAFLLAGLLMLLLPFAGIADPTFFTGNNGFQNHTICGGVPIDISSWLSVFDPTIGNTDTLEVLPPGPSNGSLSGFPTWVLAGGSGTPTGLMYIPPADPSITSDNFTIQVRDNMGHQATVSIILTINPAPSLTLGTVNPVCSGVTTATLHFSDLTNVGPASVTYNYTGAMQTFTVPANVTSVKFDLMGASGGNDNFSPAPNPGTGGRIRGTLSVTPGQQLNIFVGGKGGDGTVSGGVGGYNGGGNSQFYFYGAGGAGGGATDIRINGTGLSNRKVVAGGGGGSGADLSGAFAGGNGGGTTGGSSDNNQGGSHAGGGTQSSGGAPATFFGWTPGSFGSLGNGGTGSSQGISGGGGGGYFGGGGGVWTGGGGGSSFADNVYTTAVIHTQGGNTGDGMATINYVNPGTYYIIWDTAAHDSGFVNVSPTILPENSEIALTIPAAVTPGTYGATLYISNSNPCTSPGYHFTITVKERPTFLPISDQIICNGDTTTDISFSTSVSGSSVTWVNDNPSIGLPAGGSGHIPSFTPLNSTHDPIIANITATPIANQCVGDSQTFHIINNPIPELNSTPTPTRLCNNDLFSYVPTSLTAGTSFAWSRAAVTGISTAASSGTGNPNESLTNSGLDPVNAVYVYTLTAAGCINTVNVTVQVNPTPQLTSTHTPAAVCNDNAFIYTPVSSTTSAILNWSRGAVTGISNAAGSGTGVINEALHNTTILPRVVSYVYAMDINGCITTQSLPVTVNPTPALTSSTAISYCSGDVFSYTPSTAVSTTSVTWTRPAVAGINAPTASSGTGGFSDVLTNTTALPLIVNYLYTMTAYGCSYTQTVAATVRAKAKLSTSLTPAGICTNTMFNYTPATATPGTTITWTRDRVPGISNEPVSGTTSSVSEILYDTTAVPVNVDYHYILLADGCIDSQTVTVVVNPLPKLSNNVSALAICDSTKFDFNPASATPGATFAWSRPYTAGVNTPANSGTGNPNEYLNNTTYITVDVPYLFTITAGQCINTQSILVSVRPSPILSTSHTATACTGLPFKYEPVSYTTASTFAWSRANVAGVTPGTASGTGDIMDTLTTSSSSAVTVTYVYTLTVAGTTCSNKQDVIVTVNPGPAVPVIGTHPSATLCGNAGYMNFGAATPAASGLSYSWTASNANVISTGTDKQFALVEFNNPGTATVTLISKFNNTSCTSTSTYSVTVSSGDALPIDVIYFDGQFVCRQTQVSSYQWGYDNANSTDSTILVGETNQNYANSSPDWTNNRYWVLTNHDGCMQKTYFNKPTGVDDMDLGGAAVKVFPNPANNFINVEINSLVNEDVNVEVSNILGQKIDNVTTTNHKAQISVAGLPAGCYLVDCFSNGVKIAAVRFIKN